MMIPAMRSHSAFRSTVGSVFPETVKRYIENQKGT